MAFRPPVAVFDACILYPFELRNIILQLAVDRLVEGRWSDAIQDEWRRTLVARAPGIPAGRLQRICQLMNQALPMATVSGYESLIPGISLPDWGDRHVVAVGIAACASLILTWNVRHFPEQELRKFGLRAETPDAFLAGLYDREAELTIGSLANARRNLSKSRASASGFVEVLKKAEARDDAERAQKHVGDH